MVTAALRNTTLQLEQRSDKRALRPSQHYAACTATTVAKTAASGKTPGSRRGNACDCVCKTTRLAISDGYHTQRHYADNINVYLSTALHRTNFICSFDTTSKAHMHLNKTAVRCTASKGGSSLGWTSFAASSPPRWIAILHCEKYAERAGCNTTLRNKHAVPNNVTLREHKPRTKRHET